MKEVTVRGVRYQLGALSARTQWNVLRRIAPVLKGAVPAIQAAVAASQADTAVTAQADGQGPPATAEAPANGRLMDIAISCLGPLTEAVAVLSDVDSDYVINACLAGVRRETDGGFRPMMANGAFMFQADDNLATMIALTGHVLAENLSGFLADLPGISPSSPVPPRP